MLISPWSDSFGCAALNNTLNASAQALSLVRNCERVQVLNHNIHKASTQTSTHLWETPGEENLTQVYFTGDAHMIFKAALDIFLFVCFYITDIMKTLHLTH